MGEAAIREPMTGMLLLPVPGGSFAMGDLNGDGFVNENPVHQVMLTDFMLGKYPVTQGEWCQVMGENPAFFRKGATYPVEMVSWDQVQEFIGRLNASSAVQCRLPTEAEWEYAARGGIQQQKWAGTNDPQAAPEYVWYDENGEKSTQPVGRKRPNFLGLHDMSGNVAEWVEDAYLEDAYYHHAPVNPVCHDVSSERVIRGGSWFTYLLLTRCSDRSILDRRDRAHHVGFRLAADWGGDRFGDDLR